MHAQTRDWLVEIGRHLNESAKLKLDKLWKAIKVYNEFLTTTPGTIEDLKEVLNLIKEVQEISPEMELEYIDIGERYRTLHMYCSKLYSISEEEVAQAGHVRQMWLDLVALTKRMNHNLGPVKKKFAKVTVEEVARFREELAASYTKMREEGPAANKVELDSGLEQMGQLVVALTKYQNRRDEYVDTQKLFDLEIMPFTSLLQMQQLYSTLKHIFDTYDEFMAAQRGWASLLFFGEVDVAVLKNEVERFKKKASLLPTACKQFAASNNLEHFLVSFGEGLPLIAELKSDALRDRHWKKLMEITGKTFDISPKSFTLEDLFGLNLAEYAELVSEICTGAVKELAIEQGIRQIEETWRKVEFEMYKYTKKNNQDIYLLQRTDEIILQLDDNTMTLQSMSASRFVAAFQETVRNWERKLSHIGEVVEMWNSVQKKWQYLEGIFVGMSVI
jgi:dynein heavy chain